MSSYLSWVASAVGGTRSPLADFPYIIGDPVPPDSNFPTLWTLNNGQRKSDKSPVSIFTFQIANNQDSLPLIKNAYKRSKTLRHPNLLHFVDGLETETTIYIVTPHVVPLSTQLGEAENEAMLSWGLHQILKGITFLNEDANLVHGSIAISSIYVDDAGEFKLSGFEVLGSLKEEDSPLVKHYDLLFWLQKYRPPEVLKSGWAIEKTSPAWAIDVWYFGCLIYELFNGPFQKIEQIKTKGNIPEILYSVYKDIMKGDPKLRPSPSQVLERCSVKGGFFSNDFVQANLFLENFALKEAYEKDQFFRRLTDAVDSFPVNFCKYKVLPELVNALEFGSAGSKVLAPLMKIGAKLTPEEYDAKVVTAVVKMFAQTDRAMRMSLLENLSNFIDHLTPKLVNQSVFPHVCTGFLDSQPNMREATIKSMILFAPKLASKEMDELLRYFAKSQLDEEPGIRTNTTICLGRISDHLNAATKKRVLISAFSRALKDPFAPARNAGIMAFQATKDFHSVEDIACKILPSLTPLLVDPELSVRQQAFKTSAIFFKQLETAIKDQAVINTQTQVGSSSVKTDGKSEPVDGWAGWAVSSLSTIIAGSSSSSSTAATPTTAQASSNNEKAADGSSPAPTKTVSSGSNGLRLNTTTTPKPQSTRKSPAADGWDNDDMADLLDEADTKTTKNKATDEWAEVESKPSSNRASSFASSSFKVTASNDDDDAGAWEPLDDASIHQQQQQREEDNEDRDEAARKKRDERKQRQAERKKAAQQVKPGPPRLGAVRKVE